jgi:hypothetical protein
MQYQAKQGTQNPFRQGDQAYLPRCRMEVRQLRNFLMRIGDSPMPVTPEIIESLREHDRAGASNAHSGTGHCGSMIWYGFRQAFGEMIGGLSEFRDQDRWRDSARFAATQGVRRTRGGGGRIACGRVAASAATPCLFEAFW